MATKRLWECNHSYYCNEGNYHARDCGSQYKTFAGFLASEGESDMDYNLLFRWDWQEQDSDENSTYNCDDYYRNGRLLLFFMGQRKGAYRWVEVKVCRADETAVISYLEPRFRYLMALWEPFPTPSLSAEGDQ
jgi:hypothetical protein